MQDVVRGDKPDVTETYERGAESDAPLFEKGEVIEMRGYKFKLERVNASSLVWKPLPVAGIGRARDVIWEITH